MLRQGTLYYYKVPTLDVDKGDFVTGAVIPRGSLGIGKGKIIPPKICVPLPYSFAIVDHSRQTKRGNCCYLIDWLSQALSDDLSGVCTGRVFICPYRLFRYAIFLYGHSAFSVRTRETVILHKNALFGCGFFAILTIGKLRKSA